jgi:voltage-gated potassium channel
MPNDDVRDKCPTWLLGSIQLLIMYSVVTMALETVPSLDRFRLFFRFSEVVVVLLFTVEYLAFWGLAANKRRYPFRLMNIVDLLAILPFYLQLGIDLRAIRSLRLLRIFRVLKLTRYSNAMDTLSVAVRRSLPELYVTGLLAFVMVIVSSIALFSAEHDAQPDAYSSVPAAMWAVIVTLTTVGYGDVYPITVLGRIISMFIMLAGIACVAMPTSIIGSRLTDILQERRDAERQKLFQTVRYKSD